MGVRGKLNRPMIAIMFVNYIRMDAIEAVTDEIKERMQPQFKAVAEAVAANTHLHAHFSGRVGMVAKATALKDADAAAIGCGPLTLLPAVLELCSKDQQQVVDDQGAMSPFKAAKSKRAKGSA